MGSSFLITIKMFSLFLFCFLCFCFTTILGLLFEAYVVLNHQKLPILVKKVRFYAELRL